jgi:hypothetical protein
MAQRRKHHLLRTAQANEHAAPPSVKDSSTDTYLAHVRKSKCSHKSGLPTQALHCLHHYRTRTARPRKASAR